MKNLLPSPSMHVHYIHHAYLPPKTTDPTQKGKGILNVINFHPKEIQFPFTVTLRFCFSH